MTHIARTLSCVALLIASPPTLASWWTGMPEVWGDVEIASAKLTITSITLKPCAGVPQTVELSISGDLVDGVALDTPSGCWLSAEIEVDGPIELMLRSGDTEDEEAYELGGFEVPMLQPGTHGAGLWLKPLEAPPAELPPANNPLDALLAALVLTE